VDTLLQQKKRKRQRKLEEETRSEWQGVPTKNRKAARGESLSVSAKVAFHVSFFADLVVRVQVCHA